MSREDANIGGFDCRQAFADELAAMARDDARIVAVCNDSVGSSNLVAFRKEFPERVINVGIAEQNMVGVAAGLANGGYLPFVCAASPFLTGRALEQIKAVRRVVAPGIAAPPAARCARVRRRPARPSPVPGSAR